MKKEESLIAGRYRVIKRTPLEERGVDEHGMPVLVRPAAGGRGRVAFIELEELERAVRVVATIETPWLLPVLCFAPRVVYAAPPPATRLTALAPRDAALCVLQLCEVLARLHAAGWAGICTDVHNLRVARKGEGWRVTVVLPHLPSSGGHPYSAPWSPRTSVRHDLQAAAGFLRDLLIARAPVGVSNAYDLSSVWSKAPALAPLGDESLHAVITRVLAGETSNDLPCDAASLAERVLPLARREDWAARVAALPRVQAVVVRRDWDRVIELGDAELATGAHPSGDFVGMPLAAALHQRACIAYARRDLPSALRDVNRAIRLDPWPRYLVTRGVVRDAMGDRAGARADYDRVVTEARSGKWPGAEQARFEAKREGPKRAFEGARALYARGVARMKTGDMDAASGDLAEALAMTLALREEGGDPRFSPPDDALVSLEGIIRRAQPRQSD